MADTKISQLPAAAALTGGELLPVVQGGATKVATVAEVWAAVGVPTLDGLSDVAVAGAAQGAILYRAASGWVHLAAGTAGQVLTSGGAGASPSWDTPAAWASQEAAMVLASPSGSAGVPAFRALVIGDVTNLQSGLDAVQRIGVNTQSGTAYALVAGDAGKVVRCSNAEAITVTVPTAVLTIGDVIMIRQVGAGQVTLSGAMLNLPAGQLAKTRTQGSVISLHCVAAGVFDVSGDLA